MSKDGKNKNNRNVKKSNGTTGLWKKYNLKWVIVVSIWTFLLTILFSIAAEVVLMNTTVIISFIILIIIVFLGVFSDMIGIAVTVASDKPFHAMASDRVEGARYAINLLKNASTVSNFCNDVVGDICGIVSGVAGANIILQLAKGPVLINRAILTILITAFVASLTVGGKAIGKSLSINQSHIIVFNTARALNYIDKKIGTSIIKDQSKNRRE
ncbi:hypothetical protein RH915_01650 [Serpentinicella sp. ANB-PHB4]|uniref:hypothetical protein n=1 Tax=Serpentinicella sp. ANB-PHB4 TaxID=3074076 RepID=UPI0028666E5A|nr:hypothetical protein [Serpentinicella sp. ANB-PHB4]MDR5658185.1 hypothetical protein [Serpentinicella sp. ANB-PHB4]